MRPTPYTRRRGFTLVELLVVIGIIALLISILLPSLSRAREAAKEVQCASNIRQLAMAMVHYTIDFEGKFSPNIFQLRPAPPAGEPTANFWYDEGRIGLYLPEEVKPSPTSANPTFGGGVFTCPSDIQGAQRSFAINLWASSRVDQYNLNWSPQSMRYADGTYTPFSPFLGEYFSSNVSDGANVILFAESHPRNSTPSGFWSNAGVGLIGGASPGEHFTGVTGYAIGAGNFGGGLYPLNAKNSDVAMHRHAREMEPDAGIPTEVDTFGRANFAFVDGHVEMLKYDELADPETGISKLEAKWSPYDDFIVEQQLQGNWP